MSNDVPAFAIKMVGVSSSDQSADPASTTYWIQLNRQFPDFKSLQPVWIQDASRFVQINPPAALVELVDWDFAQHIRNG
jgi:hypothetical protein